MTAASAYTPTDSGLWFLDVCTASVTVGVDAHDAGISADGVELFACERCCDECGEAS